MKIQSNKVVVYTMPNICYPTVNSTQMFWSVVYELNNLRRHTQSYKIHIDVCTGQTFSPTAQKKFFWPRRRMFSINFSTGTTLREKKNMRRSKFFAQK